MSSEDMINKRKTREKRERIALIAGAIVFVLVCVVLWKVSSSGNEQVFPVYINEILASNTRYPNDDGRCCDYIELYNSADYPVDLSNFQVGDIGGNKRYAIPAGTTLNPGEYYVVYCDKTVADESYAQFGISRAGGETIYLLTSNNIIADSVETVATDLDQPMVRLESDEWGISNVVTPGQGNDEAPQSGQVVYNPAVSSVRITELMSTNAKYPNPEGVYCDWIELYNTSSAPADISGFVLSDNVGIDKFLFPEGTVIAANGYLVVYCTDEMQGEMYASFGLSQLGDESIVLKNREGMIVEMVDTVAMGEDDALALGSDNVWAVTHQGSPGFENGAEGHAAYQQSIGVGARTVVISELMAASQAVLPSSYSEFSDWIELYNTTDTQIDMTGWFRSDDPVNPTKWEFPQLILQPGQRTVIYCSGRDTVHDGEIHTNFSLSSDGENIVLSTFLAVTADAVTFSDAKENHSIVFDALSEEPASSAYPSPGYQNDMEGYEQFCASNVSEGPLAIWEVMTSNDWYLPQPLGECYDWVEIRNTSDAEVQLSEYSITDDPDVPGMYVLPEKTLAPGETYVIILSGDESLTNKNYDHAGFALNAMKDQLFLFHGSGKLLDYVLLESIPLGYSYGRSESSGGFFYMEPSPEAANASGNRMISDMPTSEVAEGVYSIDASIQVPLEAAGVIYYTTDGSDPDASSLRYEGPVQIDKTTVLRAVAVEDGKLQSGIYTATFIFQEPHGIPVVSLVTDPDNLWSKDKGIYKGGDLAIKEEKRSAHLSYSGEDGSFSIDCEISLHGATTVLYAQKKSFTVRFHDNYEGPLNYDVFEDGEVTKFSSLLLRAATESTFSSHMRDTLMSYKAAYNSDYLISQKYKYVAMYLNGEYWGLYAIREHHSVEHYATYREVPVSSVSMISKWILYNTPMYKIYTYCENNDFKTDKAYEYANSVLDVNSFADWIIFQAYVGNIDINENVRYYYSTATGLWEVGLLDQDLGMFNREGFELVANSFHHGVIPTALMRNEEFQHLLATRLAELLAGPMSDESMIATIDMMADTIRQEAALDRERWGGTAYQWGKMVDELRVFCEGRSREMITSLCAYLGFTQAEKETYFGHLLES